MRYRAFESPAHLNQLAEAWLRDEADARRHGTTGEVVATRFAAEAPALKVLPSVRYDTSYRELRHVSWDAYVEVRGNRYRVPFALAGRLVALRIGLDDTFSVWDGDRFVVSHALRPRDAGWVALPEPGEAPDALWPEAPTVQRRDLSVYEELAAWS